MCVCICAVEKVQYIDSQNKLVAKPVQTTSESCKVGPGKPDTDLSNQLSRLQRSKIIFNVEQ